MMSSMLSVVMLLLVGCATHNPYGAAEFREAPVQYERVALHEKGLTAEQIATISATRPPAELPVDVALLIITNHYVEPRIEEMFTYGLVQGLKSSEMFDRITLVPDFLIPEELGFAAIQELGVRSLSEYVLVFHLDASEVFRWTELFSSKYELSSAISYIVVDSGTSAMLTADRLHSTHEYKDRLFERGEEEEAQKAILTEQAQLLSSQLDALFNRSERK